ncbi:Asp-tRNA(Asn)/Glu-tRNA(Gln) amidotransferase subunit GatA [candidate division WWE3 bacterium]|nr:Asp-tRNA(Asn)/Glu-tRNA(Gln) amidotransferase subunit GatA [candidate division WWE3 bacterium]
MSDLNKLTITQALSGLKNKEFTSEELTRACLDVIEDKDLTIKAFITVLHDSALEQAKQADKLISSREVEVFNDKPLLGIPYAAKDNFCTKGIETTAGSQVLKDFVPPYESTVTQRLKDAGAVLLGKTNMDAFAHGSSTEESDFFTTKNPWDYARVPGGSSGGSAAAVIADMCIFAIGSETGGSIRGPASWCGTTGLKPTYGRVSRYGVIAMASSTDSPGPLTKTATDAAHVLKVLAGKDPLDATTSPVNGENYPENLINVSLKGLKVGKPRSYFEIDLQEGVAEKVNGFLKFLENEGAEIINVDLLDPKYSIAVYTLLQRSEVSSNLARFDGIRYGNDRDSFGFEARKRMMLGAYALSAGYYDEYYAKAQKVRTLLVEDFDRVFNRVDILVGPTMPCVAMRMGESAENPMFGEMMDKLTEPSTIAGLTGVTVPVGFAEDLPVGAQIMGNRFRESLVLGIANAYQKATNFHERRPE